MCRWKMAFDVEKAIPEPIFGRNEPKRSQLAEGGKYCVNGLEGATWGESQLAGNWVLSWIRGLFFEAFRAM
jgi:hypothetical protein